MKKTSLTKLLGLTVAALTLTILTACGSHSGTAALSGSSNTTDPTQETTNGIAGTVLLSVNPEIEMDYDDLGNVVALNGRLHRLRGQALYRRDQRLGWSDQRRRIL